MKLKIVFESEKIRAAYMDGEKKFAWKAGDSALDVRSVEEAFTLAPGARRMINIGIRAQIVADDDLWEIQLRPRSGMSNRGILKTFGTIDYDYTGVMSVVLINLSDEPLKIEFGDRIGQMVVAPIAKPEIEFVDKLDTRDRGDRGWGASGVK